MCYKKLMSMIPKTPLTTTSKGPNTKEPKKDYLKMKITLYRSPSWIISRLELEITQSIEYRHTLSLIMSKSKLI